MPCATSAFLAGTAPRLTSEPVGVSVNNQPFLRYAPLVLSMFAAGALAACGGSSNDASRTGSPQPTESSAGAQQGTAVISDCHSASTRPTSVIVTCGDAGYTVSEITYTSWESDRAAGAGVALVSHGEHPGRYPVEFRLARPSTFHGVRLFAALHVTYVDGRGPTGDRKETFDLTTNWYTSDLS